LMNCPTFNTLYGQDYEMHNDKLMKQNTDIGQTILQKIPMSSDHLLPFVFFNKNKMRNHSSPTCT
jgi:hypothetical protein